MKYKQWRWATSLVTIFSVSACGYGFQNSRNPLYLKEGIQRIYIPPVTNNTYKAGVENIVYNDLIRTLAAHGRVTIVQNPQDADALLQGVVIGASYGGSSGTQVSGLNPKGVGSNLTAASSFVVATEYAASLVCSFTLTRRNLVPGKGGVVWSSNFMRSQPFPAANQLDVPGTTSPLINDSEFDRALADLAQKMMADVHESMLAMF